jgi:hypothetical protein
LDPPITPVTSSMEKISSASSRRASATMRYSKRLLLHEDRFGNLFEEIHRRGAAQPESGLGDAQFERLPAVGAFEFGKEEKQLDFLAESRRGQLFEAGEVQEIELFGKGEVFLQEPVSPESCAAETGTGLRRA